MYISLVSLPPTCSSTDVQVGGETNEKLGNALHTGNNSLGHKLQAQLPIRGHASTLVPIILASYCILQDGSRGHKIGCGEDHGRDNGEEKEEG